MSEFCHRYHSLGHGTDCCCRCVNAHQLNVHPWTKKYVKCKKFFVCTNSEGCEGLSEASWLMHGEHGLCELFQERQGAVPVHPAHASGVDWCYFLDEEETKVMQNAWLLEPIFEELVKQVLLEMKRDFTWFPCNYAITSEPNGEKNLVTSGRELDAFWNFCRTYATKANVELLTAVTITGNQISKNTLSSPLPIGEDAIKEWLEGFQKTKEFMQLR